MVVVFYQLDVSNESRINRVYRKQLMQQFTRLDVLVNNAAILYDTWQQHAINADLEVMNQAIITLTYLVLGDYLKSLYL